MKKLKKIGKFLFYWCRCIKAILRLYPEYVGRVTTRKELEHYIAFRDFPVIDIDEGFGILKLYTHWPFSGQIYKDIKSNMPVDVILVIVSVYARPRSWEEI